MSLFGDVPVVPPVDFDRELDQRLYEQRCRRQGFLGPVHPKATLPGSPAARERGCTCTGDYLRDAEGSGWWVRSDCPVHEAWL